MLRDEIESAAEAALEAIPERFRRELVNLAFVVEEGPGPICECGDPECEGELLGLYEGIPLPEREGDTTGLLPDVITLFAESIRLESEESDLPLSQVVRETVWHEVAHFFGFDEDKAEELERRWEDAFETTKG